MRSPIENILVLVTQLIPVIQHNQEGTMFAIVALCVCLLARR